MNNDEPIEWIVCVSLIIIYLIPYGIINHLPLHREVIPFILNENYIPFLPWTFIIYSSAFIQALIVIRKIPKESLRKIVVVIGCMVILGLLTFLLFPIQYPRELYPDHSVFVTFFRITDGAGNCFPSLHVAMSIIIAFCYGLVEKSKIRQSLMWLWTILIIISVLTTKQHYLIDIFGGIIFAIPTIFILKKYI